MKVAELIEDLRVFEPDADVALCTSADDKLTILSIYPADNDPKTVWIDLGPTGDPESTE